jgi:hypothetical protein
MRQTHEFTTPGGNKVVLNSYLTGAEAQELKQILFSALKVDISAAQAGKGEVGQLPSGFLVDQEKRAMQFLVVSFNEEKNDPITALMQQPASEYEAVVAEINKIQNPTKPQK